MGSFDVAQYLLEKGADVNSKNLRGYLHFQCQLIRLEEITFILGESPLHLAVSDGHDKMAALLLEKGASTGSRDHNGLTPVHRAAQNSEGSACISMLIEKGAGKLIWRVMSLIFLRSFSHSLQKLTTL